MHSPSASSLRFFSTFSPFFFVLITLYVIVIILNAITIILIIFYDSFFFFHICPLSYLPETSW
jgi:hypothetical protein